MATLVELQARREALLKQMTSGVKGLRQGESSAEFRDMSELEKALSLLDSQITNYGTTTRVRTVRINTKDGG